MDYAGGELEGLLANAALSPDKYIDDQVNGSVSLIDLPVGLVVWGCPCQKAAAYEAFLLTYRRSVLDFYRRVIAAEAGASKQAAEDLAAASVQGGA